MRDLDKSKGWKLNNDQASTHRPTRLLAATETTVTTKRNHYGATGAIRRLRTTPTDGRRGSQPICLQILTGVTHYSYCQK